MINRLLVTAGVLAFLGIHLEAQEPSAAWTTREAGARVANGPEPPAIVGRSVLSDGTIEFEYSDGTKRRAEKSMPPASGDGEASGAMRAANLTPAAPPDGLKDEATNRAF